MDKDQQQQMPSQKYQIPFNEQQLKSIDQTYSHEQFEKLLQEPVIDKALGCMFGSFIGDALGAYCEFVNQITPQILQQTMNMNGGGTFGLNKGQYTDDSQMSYHLLKALVKFNPKNTIKEQQNILIFNIAKQYVEWVKSKPFDIGITCRKGIQVLKKYDIQNLIKNYGQDVQGANNKINQILTQVKSQNNQSQSNGSLMRITPIPFFISILYNTKKAKSIQLLAQMKKFTKTEIKLIHCNQNLVNAGWIWVKTLFGIIIAQKDEDLKKLFDAAMQKAKEENLIEWVKQVQANEMMNGVHKMGWAKIAWSYGMRVLRKVVEKKDLKLDDQFYKDQIKRVIKQGGDTDTNAAIVGGMIGSIIGFKQLPKDYVNKSISLMFPAKKTKNIDRPKCYEPRQALLLAINFIKKIKESQQQMPKI